MVFGIISAAIQVGFGALLGFLAGGPIGLLVGAVVGLLVGAVFGWAVASAGVYAAGRPRHLPLRRRPHLEPAQHGRRRAST